MNEFEPRPDSGRLMATKSKKHDKAPDYYGEIAIDMSNKTKVEVRNGLTIIKLSGWKRTAKNGNVYLSLGVDRYVGKTQKENDEDVPF